MTSKAVRLWPAVVLDKAEQRQRGVEIGQRDERGGLLGRLGEQLEDRGGDDAERPLRADEQVLQVVARVVLLQALEAVPDAPVGQHHLEAEHQLARIAVSQHARRRRRWWRGCRRSGSCPPTAGSAGTADRRCRLPPAPRPASGRPRPSWCSPQGRARARASRRPTESRISPRIGVCPPTRPVLPACGTTGMPCSWASARIRDTSSVVPGRSTIDARPSYMPRHSRR